MANYERKSDNVLNECPSSAYMVEKLLSRVVNMRESALLAALYIGKQLLSALYGENVPF